MDDKLESVGLSLICLEAALHAILSNIQSRYSWKEYLSMYFRQEQFPRGLVKALGAEDLVRYMERVPERVELGKAFLEMCATRNVDRINDFLRDTGIRMTASAPSLTSIYSGSKLKLSWRWPAAVAASRFTETLTPHQEAPRFQFVGKARVAWLGRAWNAEKFNMVTVEIVNPSVRYDMNVTLAVPTKELVSRWRQAAREPAVQRLILVQMVMHLRDAVHDVEEIYAYLEKAVVPCVDLQFEIAQLDELTGLKLPGKYSIAQAAHVAKLQMNEHGGSVSAGVGMRADKGLPEVNNALPITLRFDQEKDGFLVVVQCTKQGVPDKDPGQVLVSWVCP